MISKGLPDWGLNMLVFVLQEVNSSDYLWSTQNMMHPGIDGHHLSFPAQGGKCVSLWP